MENNRKRDTLKAMMDAARNQAQKYHPELPESWMAYKFRHVANGIMVTGSETRPLKSGPNKGKKKPLNSFKVEVFIDNAMIDAELAKQDETASK